MASLESIDHKLDQLLDQLYGCEGPIPEDGDIPRLRAAVARILAGCPTCNRRVTRLEALVGGTGGLGLTALVLRLSGVL